MSILETLLQSTGCAEELPQRPRNWQELMTAIAIGAIDCDVIAELTSHCSSLADQGEVGGAPWSDAVIEALLASDGDLESPASRVLIACGKAADDWLMLHAGQG